MLRQASSSETPNKLYELRVYSMKTGNIKAFTEFSKECMPIRYRHSSGLGFFFSEIGAIGEAIHIWEYDSYAHRATVRSSLADDADWVAKSSAPIGLLEKQDNLTMRLFPWSAVQTGVQPGGAYFLYNFSFLPELTTKEISHHLERFIKDAGLTALGVWNEEIGKNAFRSAHAVFHSADMDSESNPALASPCAWIVLNRHTSNVQSKLLNPAPWSQPWK